MSTTIRLPRKSGASLFKGNEHLRWRGNTDMGPIEYAVLPKPDGTEHIMQNDGSLHDSSSGNSRTVVYNKHGFGSSGTGDGVWYGTTTTTYDNATAICVFANVDVTGLSTCAMGIDYYNFAQWNSTEKPGLTVPSVSDYTVNISGPRGESGVAIWGVTPGTSQYVAINGRSAGSSMGGTGFTRPFNEGSPMYIRGIANGSRNLLVHFANRWSDAEILWYSETPERVYNLLFNGNPTHRTIVLPSAAAAATTSTVIRTTKKSGARAPSHVTGINWANTGPGAVGVKTGFKGSLDGQSSTLELVGGARLTGSPYGLAWGCPGASGVKISDFQYPAEVVSVGYTSLLFINARDFGQWGAAYEWDSSADVQRIGLIKRSTNTYFGLYHASARVNAANGTVQTVEDGWGWLGLTWNASDHVMWLYWKGARIGTVEEHLIDPGTPASTDILRLGLDTLETDVTDADIGAFYLLPYPASESEMAYRASTTGQWDWLNQGTRTISLPAAASTGLTTIRRKL